MLEKNCIETASLDPLTLSPCGPLPSSNRGHLGCLDGMRALAALYVVLAHSHITVWLLDDKSSPHWLRWLYPGFLSVDVFIVLSGFCLMLPIVRGDGNLRGGAVSFFRKRGRRILPPYYAAMAFSYLLICLMVGRQTGEFWDISLPVSWHDTVAHLLLLQNFSAAHRYKINYVFWSISLEWWIYFLFPPLVWAWKQLGAGIMTVATVAASYALVGFCAHTLHDTFTLQLIGLFGLGMLGCELSYTNRMRVRVLVDRLPWEAITGVAIGLTVLAFCGKIPHLSTRARVDFWVGLATMCLLVMLSARQDSLLKRILSHRSVVFLGSFSYSIYLIHAPLIAVLWQYVLRPLYTSPLTKFWLLELVGTPFIIACAYLFHLAFERPFMSAASKSAPRTKYQAEAAAIESPAP